jgi:hypothetical protein
MNPEYEFGIKVETRMLQIAVAICSVVPISAGAAGVLQGVALFDEQIANPADLDAHFRYLSGLLLGIGLAYISAVPGIEQRRHRFLLLGGLVVLGGVGRLVAVLSRGSASPIVIGALVMELLVTPALTVWQLRISRRTTP